jgi:site-specific recombinase XerD
MSFDRAMQKTINLFEKALVAEEASPLTIKNYLLDLSQFSSWFEGTNGQPLTLPAITPTDVRVYKDHLRRTAKPATVNRRLASIRKLCRWAKRKGLLKDDPTDGIKAVERIRTAPRALSSKELNALMRAVERHGNERDSAIVLILRHTGLRVSELANVKLADLKLSDRKGLLTVRSGKGGKWREVPLNTDLRRSLRAYLTVRPKDAEDDHVFIGQRRTGMTSSGIQDVIEKYVGLANLEGVSPHTLRHTFGKSLLDSGENLVTVADLMGHSRLDTTALYTQPTAADKERAVERISLSET